MEEEPSTTNGRTRSRNSPFVLVQVEDRAGQPGQRHTDPGTCPASASYLDGGHRGDGVDDVFDEGTARQVVEYCLLEAPATGPTASAESTLDLPCSRCFRLPYEVVIKNRPYQRRRSRAVFGDGRIDAASDKPRWPAREPSRGRGGGLDDGVNTVE